MPTISSSPPRHKINLPKRLDGHHLVPVFGNGSFGVDKSVDHEKDVFFGQPTSEVVVPAAVIPAAVIVLACNTSGSSVRRGVAGRAGGGRGWHGSNGGTAAYRLIKCGRVGCDWFATNYSDERGSGAARTTGALVSNPLCVMCSGQEEAPRIHVLYKPDKCVAQVERQMNL